MLTDLELANLCQAQYDGDSVFNYTFSTAGVDYSIACFPTCTAIVFEGSHDLPDWVSNFEALMQQVSDFGGVERGFYSGLPQAFAQARPLIPLDLPVYVTGHSRGAAHAQIFGAMLIIALYNVEIVVFGSPRPGDANLAAIINKIPNRSYRNFNGFDTQDFVTDVPLDLTLIAPFVHPSPQILIDVVPPDPDPWGLFKMHHLSAYIKGLEKIYA